LPVAFPLLYGYAESETVTPNVLVVAPVALPEPDAFSHLNKEPEAVKSGGWWEGYMDDEVQRCNICMGGKSC